MIDERLKRMVELNVWLCSTANVGYDQLNRFDFPSYDFATHSGDEEYPGETDCSAIVYYCAKQAGFPIRYVLPMYTGTIVRDLKAIGFQSITWSSSYTASDLKFGDVLYKSGHVAQWSGKYILEAYEDENGGSRGGKAGDQANETRLSLFRGGWELILRFPEVREPIVWPKEPEEDMVEVDFVIEEGGNNVPNGLDNSALSYSYTKWASGKLDVLISDYYNPVNNPSDYYGNPYTTKGVYFPSELPPFIEPPRVTGFTIKGSSDLLNVQVHSIDTEHFEFWVWNVQTTNKKRFLIPRFSVDVKLEGYWR